MVEMKLESGEATIQTLVQTQTRPSSILNPHHHSPLSLYYRYSNSNQQCIVQCCLTNQINQKLSFSNNFSDWVIFCQFCTLHWFLRMQICFLLQGTMNEKYESVGRRSQPTRASQAGMASPEEESTSTTGKLVTRTSLCCGCTVYTTIRAGRTSTTAWGWPEPSRSPSTGRSWRGSKFKTFKGQYSWTGGARWVVCESRGCSTGGGEESELGGTSFHLQPYRLPGRP